MPTLDTFDYLTNAINSGGVSVETPVNDRLAQSLEKAVTVTASSGTFTIDPNTANMFIVPVTSNCTIALSALTNAYTSTGSVISILLTKSNSSYTVTWPNTINWADDTAPELTTKNLITLMNFPNQGWFGGCIDVSTSS